MNYLNVISLGAGKQSSYMLLNALEGKYKYKPDFVVFADTGCEPKYVYDYLKWLENHTKTKYNMSIYKVQAGNLRDDVVGYINGLKNRASQPPFFLENNGFLKRRCTIDYKIKPVRKFIKNIKSIHGNDVKVRLWIGISLDEMERMSISQVKYIEHYYPLVEHRITIDSIISWFNYNNLSEPGKSACLICPFHSFGYWQLLKRQFPNEFEEACKFDDVIRNYPRLKSKAYLTRFRKPLREIDLTQHPTFFPELIEECYGLCGL